MANARRLGRVELDPGSTIGGNPVSSTSSPPAAHAASHAPGAGDPLATAAAGAIAIGDAAAEGAAASFARSDHKHSLAAPAAPANVTKAAAAAGVATAPARADHKHDVSTAAPLASSLASAASEGTATTLARSDHQHQSNTAPVNVTKSAAAVGTSGQPARADHKHDVTTAAGTANPPGTANAEGVATSLARSDHKHALAAFGSAAGTFCEGNDPRLVFGNDYNFKPTASFSTTSGTPVVADTFAPGGPFTGRYRLGFRCEFGSDTAAQDVEIELRRTDGGAVQIAYNEAEPNDGDDFFTFSHFGVFSLAGASPTFDLRVNSVGGANATVNKIRWEWWRVS